MQYFFFVLQNVVNIFVFVGSVASYEYLTKTVSNMVNLVGPVKIYTVVCACFSVHSGIHENYGCCLVSLHLSVLSVECEVL